eukprot:8751769-Pyramimonas_sp.AAC.2
MGIPTIWSTVKKSGFVWLAEAEAVVYPNLLSHQQPTSSGARKRRKACHSDSIPALRGPNDGGLYAD